ncbi:MAG: hypothetical protein ABEI86_07410, partial [Halobacteriaceae archaeon]
STRFRKVDPSDKFVGLNNSSKDSFFQYDSREGFSYSSNGTKYLNVCLLSFISKYDVRKSPNGIERLSLLLLMDDCC